MTFLVVDELHTMVKEGFEHQLSFLAKTLRPDRQTVLSTMHPALHKTHIDGLINRKHSKVTPFDGQ